MRIEWQQPPGSHSLVVVLHSGEYDRPETYSIKAIRMYNAVPSLISIPATVIHVWTTIHHTTWTIVVGEGEFFSVTQKERSIVYIVKDLRLECYKHWRWPEGIPRNKAGKLKPMEPPQIL